MKTPDIPANSHPASDLGYQLTFKHKRKSISSAKYLMVAAPCISLPLSLILHHSQHLQFPLHDAFKVIVVHARCSRKHG